MKEYLIGLGLDGKDLFKNLKDTIGVLEQVEAKSGEVGRTMDEAFEKGAQSSAEFDKKIVNTSKHLEAIKEMGKTAGKELAGVFDGKNFNPSEYGKKIDAFKEKLSNLTANVDIKLDDEKIRIFSKEIEGAKTDVEQLNVALKFGKEIMGSLDPNSEAYKELSDAIVFTESALQGFEEEVVQTVGKSKSLKAELKDIKNALQAMELAGDSSSNEFIQMSIRAGQLEDQIGDTNAQIRILSSDTAKFDGLISGVTGLVGAFTAVQGAVGLFGAENEELQEALLKVNSAMAVLQGLQAVSDTLNKDSAFSVIFLRNARIAQTTATVAETGALGANTVAMTASTVATKLFSVALVSIGIGVILIAIAALVEYWDDLTGAVKKFLPAGTDVGKSFDKIKSISFGLGNALLQYVIAPFKIVIALMTDGLDGAVEQAKKSYNVIENFAEGKRTQDLRNQKKYLQEREQANIDFAKRELERRANRGEDVSELQRRNQARQLAFNRNNNIKDLELQKDYEDNLDKAVGERKKKAEENAKKASEQAKKNAEDAKKKAEEAQKNAIELAKKQNEQIEKFANELKVIEIENIDDKANRERASLEKQFDDKISAIEKEKALTKKAEADQIKIISELKEAKAKKLKEFDENIIKERTKIEMEANSEIQSLAKDSQEKELELLKINNQKSLDAINEKYKNEEDLRLKLIEATEKNTAEKSAEIKNKYASDALKNDEEKAMLSIELASQYANKSEKTERQKQIALLNVKLSFAEKALDLLTSQGKDENSLEVLNAKKAVQDTQNAVNKAVAENNNQDFDFLDFLGIGEGLSDEENKKLRGAIRESMQVLSDFTSFMIDNVQAQMDKKQEQIDQTQSEIDDLEDKLDNEKELRDNGFANNVELIEAEIAEKEKQKEAQIKQEEELLEKKKQFQKLQLALDTAQQLSGLITASVNIFEGFSTIPIVGIPLAISMIGLMFGTFVASKAKALQSINQQSAQYGEGGEISGRSHGQGGEKYYNADGSKVKELEDGEFVVRRKQYGKFGSLVRAINNDDFSGLSINDYAMAEIFSQMGFDIDSGVGEAKNLQLALMSMGYSAKESKHLADISEGISHLVEESKNTPKSWFDGTFDFTKIGNKTTKQRRTPIKEDDGN